MEGEWVVVNVIMLTGLCVSLVTVVPVMRCGVLVVRCLATARLSGM